MRTQPDLSPSGVIVLEIFWRDEYAEILNNTRAGGEQHPTLVIESTGDEAFEEISSQPISQERSGMARTRIHCSLCRRCTRYRERLRT